MIDRWTTLTEEPRECGECGEETTHTVVSASSPKSRLGFEGERYRCHECDTTEEVRA